MAGPLKQALRGKSDAGSAGFRPARDGVMRRGLEIKLIPEGGTAPVVPVHLAKRA